LHLFYAMHAHSPGMEKSALDTTLARVDRRAATNFANGLDALGDMLAKHGVRASIQLTEATALAVCTVAGPGVLQKLAADGHDIGVHGHEPSQMMAAVVALKRDCGISPKTGSGLVGPGVLRSGGGTAGPRKPPRGGGGFGGAGGPNPSVFLPGARDAVRAGLQVLTLNATPSQARVPAISRACQGRFGANASHTPTSGALGLAWRPDLAAGNICGGGFPGSLVLLDHAPGDWLLAPGGTRRESVDQAGDRQFDLLKPMLQAALSQPRASGRTQSWGFVSHLHEFMPGTDGAQPISAESLAAFARWLSWVDRTAQGQVVWSTPPEIAAKTP
jgi:hypothetical protein